MARDEVALLEMAARIKELRESHGYKQQFVADKVGVELRTYQFWQQGKHAPEQDALEKLAKLFGVTPKYILRGDTPDLSSRDQLDRIEQRLERMQAVIEQLAGNEVVAAALEELQRAAASLGAAGRKPAA